LHSFEFDVSGLLYEDSDPAGGYQTFARGGLV
jgi:hypothetical protein